jgi:DNA-binding transcriptional regulator YiaG
MKRLKEWRERLELTPPQMARYVGVSYHAWLSWENGSRSPRGPAKRLMEVLQMVEVMAPVVHSNLMGE